MYLLLESTLHETPPLKGTLDSVIHRYARRALRLAQKPTSTNTARRLTVSELVSQCVDACDWNLKPQPLKTLGPRRPRHTDHFRGFFQHVSPMSRASAISMCPMDFQSALQSAFAYRRGEWRPKPFNPEPKQWCLPQNTTAYIFVGYHHIGYIGHRVQT